MKVLRILPFLLICLTQITFAQLVWPGDVNNNGIVNEVDLLTLGKAFGATGPSRGDTNLDWQGQEIAENWEGTFPNGLNYAYADCNGDGRVNGQDVKIIEENFGFRHTDVPFVPDEFLAGVAGTSPSFEVLSTDLRINPNEKEKQFDLGLGNESIPVDSIIGLSFLIKLDPNAYDVQATDFKFSGWLGNGNIQVIKRPIPSNGRSAPGDFIVAYTVTNGIPISGNGLIGSIVLSPSITEIDLLDFKISIDSITMVDENLTPIAVLGVEITPTVADSLLPNNTDIDTTICQGDTLVFNEQDLTTSGMYRDTFTNQYSLDSFINLTLVVADTFHTEIDVTLCQGQSIPFNGQNLDITGTYRDTLATSNGCDSFIVLNLLVNDTMQTILTESICQGSSRIFNGQQLTMSGTYRDTLVTSNGCDSFIVLNLLVNDTMQTVLTESICQGSSQLFNGQQLTMSGTYRDTLATSNGCDSFVVLNLLVTDTVQTILTESICQGSSQLFNGQELTMSGAYRDTLATSIGCDSFVVLNLLVTDTVQTILTESICQGSSQLFNGQQLTMSGTYRDTFITNSGCDSFLVLNLTVRETVQNTIEGQICTGDSYPFNGQFLTVGGVYRDTLTANNGCDSFLILNLAVEEFIETNLTESICQGGQFSFNGQVLSSAGIYRDTLQTTNGCDSFLTLNLTVMAALSTNLNQTICTGTSFNFNGQNLSTSGTYQDTLSANFGCDSIVVLNLVVSDIAETNLSTTLCEGNSILFNGVGLTSTGIYRDTFIGNTGCDSILILNLTVLPAFETMMDKYICADETIFFNGNNLNVTGIYHDTLTATNGCDSLLTLNLTVADTFQTVFNTRICEGASLTFNGQVLSTSGTYRDTLQTANGCDSVLILNLTVNEQFEKTINATICAGETYFFNNLTLTTSGTYEVNLMAENGCDSTITLNLTVGNIENTILQTSICEGETQLFNNQALNTTGTYFDTLQTAIGCDSFIQLDLTVLPTIETVIDTLVCSGDTVVFLNFVLTTETTYWTTFTAANGCDSSVVLNLIFDEITITNIESTLCPGDTLLFNGQPLTMSGNYIDTLQNRIGCDSIIALNLTMEPNCQTTSTEEILLKNIEVYPNPTSSQLFIDATDISIQAIQIINVTGQILYQQNTLYNNLQPIDMQSFTSGVYWVILQTEYGLVQRKVVRL